MKFKASLDTPAIIISVLIFFIFAATVSIQVILLASENAVIPFLVTAVLSIVYAAAFLFRPLAYETGLDSVIIHRPIRNIRVMRHSIASVALISQEQLRHTIRTFGVGGLFGYYGKFASSTIGNMTWYATRRDRGVLLTLRDDQKILLTPDEPEQFLQALAT